MTSRRLVAAASPRPPRRSVRAVGLMFFVLVAVPILFFSFALSIDSTKVFVAQRSAARAAEAAAVAGAFQFTEGSYRLDESAAREVAADTVRAWDENGSLHLLSHLEAAQVEVSPFDGSTPQTVTVRLDYHVGGMMFWGWFTPKRGLDANVVRSATVCVPGYTDGPTGGHCQRPDLP